MEAVSYDAVTVTQLNTYLKNRLDEDENLKNLVVTGELSNFTHHRSGHFYFTLKDETASVRCIMFRSAAAKVRFSPEAGMKLIVIGTARIYERDGSVQLYCSEMHPDGQGDLQLAFEQLKKKLEREGLFAPEHKRPLPPYPECIAVVTSKTGAALQDILQILKRRYPLVTVHFYPALVQGESAPASICAAIGAAENDPQAQFMIVGRGGGSAEDLWCFNDESVARAVYDSRIPVISAVGHEIDFTITDFAADLRAPTPSAAAELAVPLITDIADGVRQYYRRIGQGIREIYRCRADAVKVSYARLQAASPQNRLNQNEAALSLLKERMQNAMTAQLNALEGRMNQSAVMLETLSPLKVLTRGYSITMSGQNVVDSVEKVAVGDELMIRFRDGAVKTVAVQVSKG